MKFNVNRESIAEGIFFTSIQSEKFKTNRISVSLIAPLSEETASDYAILPLILKKGYRECPDATAFSRLLASLYGASCNAAVRKMGANQILTLSISAIDDRFTLEGEKLTLEISKILCSLLLDPVIEDGGFKKEFFETEKQSLIDTIKSELNDKRSLAATRCQEIMFKGEREAISRFGSLSSAEALTRREVFDSYNELLKRARIEIFFTGCGCPSDSKEIFSSALLSSAERSEPYKIEFSAKKHLGSINFITEEYNITQSKLSMGFTTETESGSVDENAMSVMNLILGGAPFSKLFLNVREKLSLCYYCSAAYDHHTGTIIINSGIETENREKTQEEILKQLEALQNGEISDEEIANARRLFTNLYTGVEDSLSKLESYFMSRFISGNSLMPNEELEALLNVSKEDIINAARRVSLNTVYFMKPKEDK